jgi:hypothetical protein
VNELKAITTCVGFDDILALTLPRNVRHFSDYVVVTSLDDDRTAQVVSKIKGVRLFKTDAFTRGGKLFNKGQAIEEAFDVLGRSGWILHLDADVVLPGVLEPGPLDQDLLYGMHRRQLPEGILELDGDWDRWEFLPDPVWLVLGFFQLFHAEAHALQSRPWYPTWIGFAGMSDGDFTAKFPGYKMLEGSVLHIGRTFENWFGRATPRLDGLPVPNAHENRLRMGEFFLEQGWPVREDLQALALAARQELRSRSGEWQASKSHTSGLISKSMSDKVKNLSASS